jgi:hypothetical protein
LVPICKLFNTLANIWGAWQYFMYSLRFPLQATENR